MTSSRGQGANSPDLDVFRTLYAECFRGIYGYVAARLSDGQTAEDLTAETFLRAWRAWPPRQLTGHVPRAWLFQIARNLVIDYHRASGRRQIEPLDETTAHNPQGIPGEDEHLDSIDLHTSLATLSSRDQDVLALRLAGLSNRQIGIVLDLSEAAAGMACLRALRRLGRKLEA
jgi:RNA polymerase sigma-70 factor (ECF subfamily)